MGFFSSDSTQAQNYQDVYQSGGEHKASWTHEALGGAAAFEAARLYEQRCAAEGKPQSHALAKELLASLAGAEVDKLVETHGLDFIDREKAKHQAQRDAQAQISEDNY